MKMLTSLAVFVFAFFQFSFSTTTHSSQPSSSAASTLKAPPNNFTTTQIIPISILVNIPCANGGSGEIVELSGNLLDLFHVTTNGNTGTLKYHDSPQGVSGVGQTTGMMYQATGVTQGESKFSLVNGQYEATFVNNFRIIGQGPGNNYLVHETYHVTVDANGELTAYVDNFTVDCN